MKDEYEEGKPHGYRWIKPLVFVAAILAGCWYAVDYYMAQTWELRAAKRDLEKRLKDPTSVLYSDIDRCSSGNGVFGIYNAKNSYGAYTGETIFFAFGSDIVLDDEVYLSAYGAIDPQMYCSQGMPVPVKIQNEQWEALPDLERFIFKLGQKQIQENPDYRKAYEEQAAQYREMIKSRKMKLLFLNLW
ncbi:MAG TPA: hypothetical protein VIG90_07820 [Pedomonas sp.]|uniref:hypothetical protein n=1 Tax=Pedomonas sp. TaxID=2976421 RepID=UPI002F3E85DC